MEWQPISSAPRDGTDILIYDPDSHSRMFVAYWSAFQNGYEAWFSVACNDDYAHSITATHWMPLPSPPGE